MENNEFKKVGIKDCYYFDDIKMTLKLKVLILIVLY